MSYIYILGCGIKTTPSIEGIGYTQDASSASFGPCQRKGYTIHYVLNGKGTFNGNTVNKGQGFLVYDGMLAEHIADRQTPWELIWITLNGKNANELLVEYHADPNTGIFNFISPDFLSEAAREMCNYKGLQMDSTKIMEFFLRLHNNCIPGKNKTSQNYSTQDYTDWAVKYIKANIYRNITVNELTNRIGISQPYLYKLFKARFGMSAQQFIMMQKIEFAQNLLVNSDMSITEVANSVGYQDLLAFSRMFSVKNKISPKKYREITRAKKV